MKTKRLLALIQVNLIYRRPDATERLRQKGKTRQELTKSLLQNDLLLAFVFMLFFMLFILDADLNKEPLMFAGMLLWFGVTCFAQEITYIYNIFFGSKEQASYLALPFSDSELFWARAFAVLFSLLASLFPLYGAFLLLAWQAKVPFYITFFSATLLFLLLAGIIWMLGALVVVGLAKIPVIQRHSKVLGTILMLLTLIVILGGMSFFNNEAHLYEKLPFLKYLLPFYTATSAPLSKAGLFALGGISFLFLGLAWLTKVIVIKDLSGQLRLSEVSKVTKKHHDHQNLLQVLTVYNRRLLLETDVLLEVLSNTVLIPLFATVPFYFAHDIDLRQLDPKYYSGLLLLGNALAMMTYGIASFGANIISLDRNNYTYVKALPFDLKTYLQAKFRLVLVIQSGLTLILTLIFYAMFKLTPISYLYFLFGSLSMTYLMTLYYFKRDLCELYLNWTNVTQLFTRNGGTFALIFQWMFVLFLNGVVLTLYLYLIPLVSPLFLEVAFPILELILVLGGRYYQHKFFTELD